MEVPASSRRRGSCWCGDRRRPGQGSLCRDRRVGLRMRTPHLSRPRGSWLAVQGPQFGQDLLGAEMWSNFVRLGRKVGVTAQPSSHRPPASIRSRARPGRGIVVRIGQRTDRSGDCTSDAARPFKDYGPLRDALGSGEVDVVGGTAWLWSREEFAESVDVLVIDEAGQLSLANSVAVSGAARKPGPAGDPQQLDQPLQGTASAGAEASALGHILDGKSTMPPEMGLSSNRRGGSTRTSAGSLRRPFTRAASRRSRGWRARTLVSGPAERHGRAVRSCLPTRQQQRVARGSGRRRGFDRGAGRRRQQLDGRGRRPPCAVAGRSACRRPVQRPGHGDRPALDGVHVGTVDKFQGQEAPVSFYSMARRARKKAPRGMEFLYSLNRLNVATSRARCLAIVVASPALIRVRARTPRRCASPTPYAASSRLRGAVTAEIPLEKCPWITAVKAAGQPPRVPAVGRV